MAIDLRGVLRTALQQLEVEKQRIDRQIDAVRGALDGVVETGSEAVARGRRRRMSPAERRAVSVRMQAYWAKRRAAAPAKARSSKDADASPRAKRGRRMNAAARRAVSRRMKAYWAKQRRSAKTKRGKKAA